MLRALGWLLAVAVLAAGGWWLYTHTGRRAVSTSGDVVPRDVSADPPDANDDAGSAAPSSPAPATVAPAANTSTPAPQPAAQATADARPAAGLPVSDSIPRNPPVGMAFGGSGKYQWYRQGDITWRIDTVSGAACIDFATMGQWVRPIVYSRGCRRS